MLKLPPNEGRHPETGPNHRLIAWSAVFLLAGAIITPLVNQPGWTALLLTLIDLPVRVGCVTLLWMATRHQWRTGSAALLAFLTLSAALDLVAAVLFRVSALMPGMATQQSGDVAQLSASLCVVLGLLAVPRANRWRSAQLSSLDALVTVGGFGLLVWHFLVGPAQVYTGPEPGMASITEIAYPVLDAAMVTVLVARSWGGLTILPAPVRRALAASVVAAFVADGFIGISFYVARSPVWLFASAIGHAASTLALVMLGDMARRLPLQPPARADHRAEGALPPLAAVTASLVLLAMGVALWRGQVVDRTLFGGGIALAAVVAIRQVLAARRQVQWLREREHQLEAEVAERTAELSVVNARLEHLAAVDGLTGLANRRRFDEALAELWIQSQRSGQPMAALLLDVDAFKLYNDAFGHGAGDRVLVEVARVLAHVTRRQTDLVARYGGEEFVILCPSTTPAGAQQFADALLEAIRGASIPHGASPVASIVTVSIGVTSCVACAGGSALALIETADQALYEAKRAGRNRMIFREMIPQEG